MTFGRIENLAGMLCSRHSFRARSYQRYLAAIFIVSFSLDFKGAVGGSAPQYLMAVINTGAFALLAASYRLAFPGRGLAALVSWGWVLFLAIGTVSAIASSVPLGHYIRVIYTFILFLEGFLVAWWVARDSRGAEIIVEAMGICAVVSLLFTVWWGFHTSGVGLGQMRYQILSPLTLFVIVMAGYDYFFARRRRLWSLLMLVVGLGLIGISVTRGPVLVVVGLGAVVLMSALGNNMSSGRLPLPIVRVVAWVIVAGLVGFIAIELLYPEILSRWAHRSLGNGHLASFWTRVAAVVGQYDSLTSTRFGWLIGKGFGSSYPWPVSDFPWILRYLGAGFRESVWFPGEFMWMPFFYYGGFVAGLIAELALLVGAVRAFNLLRALLWTQSWRLEAARPAWLGVLGYIAFLGAGVTANPFIMRLAALFLGLCLGLVVSQHRLLRSLEREGVFAESSA